MSFTGKAGMFYLGRIIDPLTHDSKGNFFYDSKNLTTHAVCVGMTGSGKTGLGIGLLEEGALNKIPAIVIDPKGDLGNMLLTFPNLSPSDFKPWIDNAEAERKGGSLDEYAEFIATTWRNGLAAWGEDGERIKKFKESVDVVVYTPANNAGIPISILSSFAKPSQEELLDTSSIREKILSITSSLLGLLGINADPVKSREHILISNVIQQAWENGSDLDLPSLIQTIQKPSFTKIGALELETFYPAKDRKALAITLNNLLASPGFQAWMEGVPLDIEQFLQSKDDKPQLSIISIAHLSESERMFFVTLFLNQYLSWMRRQTGTSSLRTLLYMDEIFGFFPPIASPPSKLPMLTLLKQARAYGVGIVLATQNPVDLDYKGLANCGTWFIGKLQTERDKNRVLEGLKIASNGEMDAEALDKMVAATGKRMFILRSIYEKQPILFETRWTLSYLSGPMTLTQIATFKNIFRKFVSSSISEERPQKNGDIAQTSKPNISPEIEEYFLKREVQSQNIVYEPRLMGIAKVHFVNSKNGIDQWDEMNLVVPVKEDKDVDWNVAENINEFKGLLEKNPVANATFNQLPSSLAQEKNYSTFSKQLALFLYQNQVTTIYETSNPRCVSKQGESEKEFRERIAHEVQAKKEELIKKVKEKYETKIVGLTDKIQRLQNKVEEKKHSVLWQKIQAGISFVFTILAAALSRKVTQGTISQTGTSLRRATRFGKDSKDASIAEGEIASYQDQIKNLETEREDEIALINSQQNEDNITVESIVLHPKKSDIVIEKIALVWWPN